MESPTVDDDSTVGSASEPKKDEGTTMPTSPKVIRRQFPKGQAILDGVFDDDTLREIKDAQENLSFEPVGLDIETEYCCPKCGYEWSGRPKPNADKEKAKEAKKDGKDSQP